MMMRMQALQGFEKTCFFGFFASHIVFTVVVDSQAILPPSMIPAALRSLVTWYSTVMVKDPLMSQPRSRLWFSSLVACELLFQLPFFVAACTVLAAPTYSYSKDSSNNNNNIQKYSCYYPDWFRSACIAYGSHTATTMVPILATLVSNADATLLERVMVTSVYLPYLLFPLRILYRAVVVVVEDDDDTKKKTS